jgi:hypothetical protein
MGHDVATRRDGSRHPSPSLSAVAAVYAALFLASLVATAVLTRGEHFPSPFGPAASALDFFSRHSRAVRWSAFLQFGSAVPLGIFTATVASRLHFLGVRAAGVSIASFGGVAASVFLALSALAQWVLSWPDVLESQATVRALHLVAFSAGGPGHVVPLGLLIAGVSVTAGVFRLLPRWMMVSGLVLAALAELSTLSLVLPTAAYLLPLARFPALAWLIAAGALLPRARRGAQVHSPRATPASALPTGRTATEAP